MITALIILGSIAAVALAFAFSPFSLLTEFSVSESKRSGTVHFRWLHPRIARYTFDIESRTAALHVLGWTRRISDAAAREESPSVPAAETARSPAAPQEAPAPEGERAPEPHRAEPVRGEVEQPVYGCAAKESPSAERRVPKARRTKEKAQKERPQRSGIRSWQALKRTLSILNNRPWYSKLFHWGMRTLRVCVRLIRFDHLRLHATAGLHDPAEMGKIYGWYTALNHCLLARQKHIDLRLEPRFSEAVLEVKGSIGFTTSLFRLLAPMLVALLTFPYLSTWVIWRRLKKGNEAAASV